MRFDVTLKAEGRNWRAQMSRKPQYNLESREFYSHTICRALFAPRIAFRYGLRLQRPTQLLIWPWVVLSAATESSTSADNESRALLETPEHER